MQIQEPRTEAAAVAADMAEMAGLEQAEKAS
jgi:hypothetical protein